MTMNADLGEIALRLAVALLIGAAIGTQRHLLGQAAGLRTHALVALAAALAVLIVAPLSGGNSPPTPDAQSRVLQGILTGVGFIGAGLILHSGRGTSIHGLTSAAVIWIVAVFGALCGHGRIDIALIGFALVVLVLGVGSRVEEAMRVRFGRKDPEQPPDESG
jgi:putative Mg2+ transporter-C (MgtC) family protein